MRFVRLALCVCAAFALTVKLIGQAGIPAAPIPLQTSAKQFIAGGITVEPSGTGQTRIYFWINTAHWKAYQVVLEADKFTVNRAADGSQVIESPGSVRLSGFTVVQGVLNNGPFLQDAEGKSLTWDRGFKLQIRADGTPEWFCCPR
jgi:hypothetical protein